jgi:hypothetical protein
MACSRFFGLAAALTIGCQPTEPVVNDSGPDAADTFEPPDAPTCDVAPVPADLPALDGRFAVRPGATDAADPDAGGLDAGPIDAGAIDAGEPADGGVTFGIPPTAMGGDPTGTWVFDRVTFYTAPGSDAQFDPAASSLTGTAWAALDATTFRISLAFDITLVTFVAGTVRRSSETRVRGTYVVDGANLDVTAECADGVTSGTSSGFSFTESGDSGLFFTTVNGMLGELTIVLEGTRRP